MNEWERRYKTAVSMNEIAVKINDELVSKNYTLKDRLKEAEKVIDFYASGGNSNRDIWFDEKLGYFIGKKARKYKAKYGEK